MLKTYYFIDTFQEMKESLIVVYADSEKMAWCKLCDSYGSGYVMENIEMMESYLTF